MPPHEEGRVAIDDPETLIATGRRFIDTDAWHLSYWWSRAAAMMARQAMELSLEQFWSAHAPGARQASGRAQFLALHALDVPAAVVAEGHVTWSALSRACHHHPYDLSPTRNELAGWLDAVERFHKALVEHARQMPAR